MTKIVSPCEMALLGHSGSQAPQLIPSLVIIVAIDSTHLTLGGIGTEEKNKVILDEIPGGCKLAVGLERDGRKRCDRLLARHDKGVLHQPLGQATCKGNLFFLLLLA